MKALQCAAVKRRMSAFRDGELALDQRIAVEVHLKACDACAAEAELLDELGESLRAAAKAMQERAEGDIDVLRRCVMPRVKAERTHALWRQIEAIFDDMHLVSAAVCGMMAMTAVTGLLFSLMHEPQAQPDSLAALVETLSRRAPRSTPQGLVPPRVHPDAVMPATVMNQQWREDAMFALAATVRLDGSLSEIELLRNEDEDPDDLTPARTRLTVDLLDAVSTARFEPARRDGAPIAVNVIWVLTHTTVRG